MNYEPSREAKRIAEWLEGVVDGLERFRAIAGCDNGTEYAVVALRQIIGWMRARDFETVSKALSERFDKDRYYRSMTEAMR
jgi:hypothetical protein